MFILRKFMWTHVHQIFLIQDFTKYNLFLNVFATFKFFFFYVFVFTISLWYDIMYVFIYLFNYLLTFLHIFSQLIWGYKNGMYEGI